MFPHDQAISQELLERRPLDVMLWLRDLMDQRFKEPNRVDAYLNIKDYTKNEGKEGAGRPGKPADSGPVFLLEQQSGISMAAEERRSWGTGGR